METTQVRQETASQPAAPQKEQKGAAPKVPMPRKKKKWIKRVIVLAVLAALPLPAAGVLLESPPPPQATRPKAIAAARINANTFFISSPPLICLSTLPRRARGNLYDPPTRTG